MKQRRTNQTNQINQRSLIPVRFDRHSPNVITEKGRAVNLIQKQVEDYQLIDPPHLSTYQKYKSSINRQVNEHYSKDSKDYLRRENKTMHQNPLTNNYIAKKPSSIRESPFKAIEKDISPSSAKHHPMQQHKTNSRRDIFKQNIPEPEWLLKNRKKKEANKNDSRQANESHITKIQSICRGYASRKRLFHELRVFFQSNQFMSIIENVERKVKQRKCFDGLRSNANYDNQQSCINSSLNYTIPSTETKTYIQALNSKTEAGRYKAKLVSVLLKRMVSIKQTHLNYIKGLYFEFFCNNCIEASETSNSSNTKLFKRTKYRPYKASTIENEDVLLSIRKHLKLFMILSNSKVTSCRLYFAKWKENSHEYSEKEIRHFKTLYYIKVFTKNLYMYYARRTSTYFNLWLKKAIQSRKKTMKTYYAGMVLLHQLFNSISQRTYISQVSAALLSKQPE